jgi:hypothetical protein
MEAEMSESAIRLPQALQGGAETESSPKIGDMADVSLSASAEKYQVDIGHFKNISGELMAFLSGLSEKVRSSAQQLRLIEQAVELKTEELKRLCAIEDAATTLDRLLQKQRLEKEQFEAVMARQRSLWEEEKVARDQENEEYLERLKAERQREEEEYRRQWTVKQSKAKQELAEELQSIQKKNQADREAMEKEFLERDLHLKQKELEWMQLVQELEQFMSKLGNREKRIIPA